jgi:hypothetical protein
VAQSLSTGNGTDLNDTGHPVVLAPPPVQAGEALEMARLPVSMNPPLLYFNYGTSGRYGPYPLADNIPVGSKQTPYTLRLFDAGRHFTLQAPPPAATVYGPFPATNGAAVTLGHEAMTVLRLPPQLEVSLNHPGKINQLPLIGIAPSTPAVQKELYALRAKYQALANRVDLDTADVAFQNMPRVHSRRSGDILSPVVSTSQRDKQNAVKGAELSAVRFLETLFQQAFRVRSQSASGSSLYRFGMPPGDYVFCAMQKVKDPRAKGVAGSATAVWWTTFTFDGEHPLSLSLTAENAITWREIFTFER